MTAEGIQTLFLIWVLFMSSLILVDLVLIGINIKDIRRSRHQKLIGKS